jgi:hypothetical protein
MNRMKNKISETGIKDVGKVYNSLRGSAGGPLHD